MEYSGRFATAVGKQLNKAIVDLDNKNPDSGKSRALYPIVAKEADGAEEIGSFGGVFSHAANFGATAVDAAALIDEYRRVAIIPEVANAVSEIADQAIVENDNNAVLTLGLDETEFGESTKKAIHEEFKHVLRLFKFRRTGYKMFREWFIDSRQFHHIVIDNDKPKEGVKEVRKLSPKSTKKIREVSKSMVDGVEVITGEKEYFQYTPSSDSRYGVYNGNAVILPVDSVAFSHSGLLNSGNIEGYLHQAIKPANHLKMLEEAYVIYTIVRAPERRIFYIDVGNLRKASAQQYMQELMTQYQNKVVYDPATGKMSNKKDTQSIMEDFWIPRRDGGKSTEIDTLQGGTNMLSDTDVLQWFNRKLYESLYVPYSRYDDQSNPFGIAKEAELSRDELKFDKFIRRLQNEFSEVFRQVLKIQLLLKGVITQEEWEEEVDNIEYVYATDTHFVKMKKMAELEMNVAILRDLSDYTGKYWSHKFIMKEVLSLSDEEIEERKKEIEEEKSDKFWNEPEDDNDRGY
jgi:hypothetical protein